MREVLKHPKFVIDDTFDLLNSRGMDKNKLKCAIGNYNENIAFETFEKAKQMIAGL